jgi:hypothetical protein
MKGRRNSVELNFDGIYIPVLARGRAFAACVVVHLKRKLYFFSSMVSESSFYIFLQVCS